MVLQSKTNENTGGAYWIVAEEILGRGREGLETEQVTA